MANLSKDKGIEVFDVVPFLRSFPFDEYELDINVEGVDAAELGISPLLINVLGTFGTEEQVRFYYNYLDSKIMISIHVEDIFDIQQSSNGVETLNSHFKYLKEALESDDITKKVSSIKKSRKFIVALGVEALVGVPFGEVMAAFAEVDGLKLSEGLVHTLAGLNTKKILERVTTKDEQKLTLDYLDFQLHYAMIILGVVIAAKIH